MTGSGSFWRACCRFKGRCGPCRDHGRVRDGSSTGSTSAPRRAGANTYSSRARRGHGPRRGFACQIPVKEDKEAARRRRGGEGGREYSSGPASCTKRTVVERAFASYQAVEGAHWPPATDEPALAHTTGLLIHTILTWRTYETCPRGRVFEMFPAR